MSTGTATESAGMAGAAHSVEQDEVSALAEKWKGKPGSLIMALHDLQDLYGYVPRESAMRLGHEMGVPLARIYEVCTFYNFFKLEAPGKHIISVCLGTACHIKGAGDLVKGLEKELNIKEGESTPDKEYHLQAVRCLGCCGLAPVVSVDGKIYPKLQRDEAASLIERIEAGNAERSAPDTAAAGPSASTEN